MSVPTPHINAKFGDFADVVLMPGDPLRAKFIAEKFLTKAVEVTNVRGMLGYSGEYQGRRVSVMGHGMGIPSASIYITELYKFYDVKSIIRVGSCGAISRDVKLRDIVIAMGASTDSNVNRMRFNQYDLAACADYGLLENAVNAARKANIPVRVGNIFTTDLFYHPDLTMLDMLEKHGVLGIEMEAAGIYGVAAELGKKAVAICTVSDHIRTGEALSSDLRQTSFNEMIEVALQSIL